VVRGVTIKDHWSEQRIFDQRSLVAGVIIITLIFVLIARLFLLQVIRYDYYTELSQGNRVRNEPIPAARGLIMDRNGEVIAANQPAYQLELVPEEVQNLQQTLDGLVELGLMAPEDMNDEHVREFQTQGFIVRRGLVPPDEVAMLRSAESGIRELAITNPSTTGTTRSSAVRSRTPDSRQSSSNNS